MTASSRPVWLLVLACALVIAWAPTPAAACPPCSNYSMWTGTPCIAGNCSPCGFCAYCCDRYGIGCQYCDLVANNRSDDSACDQATTPVSADPFADLFGGTTSAAVPLAAAK